MRYEIKNNYFFFKCSNQQRAKFISFPYNNESDKEIIDFIEFYEVATPKERSFATKHKRTEIKKFCYLVNVKRQTEINSIKVKGINKRNWEFQLDHIVPVSYGFENNIPVNLISSIENLQMLTRFENMMKSNKITDEAKLLLKKWGYE